jgi:L-iditol 2-dehydrogenase
MAVREVPQPHAGPGQVVISTAVGGLCGTDLHIAQGTLAIQTPRILGHELAGTVAEIGQGVEGLALGQPVTTETDAGFCGTCPFCVRGDMHLCAERTGIGTSADGGFAGFVAVPARGVHPLPSGVDLLSGALTEPLAVAVRAVIERGRVRSGERVAVMGPGTVGLLAAQVVRTQGAAATIIGLAAHRDRYELARDLGISSHLVLDDPSQAAHVAEADGTMDVVLECSGAASAFERATRLLRKGGRLVLVGFYGERVSVDLDRAINRELTLIASRGKRPTSFQIALELMESRQIDPGRLITHRYPLEAWSRAFAAAEGIGAKVVLEIKAEVAPWP